MKLCSMGGAPARLFLLFVFLGSTFCTRGDERLGNQPIAEVDGTVLTAEEFGSKLVSKLKNYDALYAKQEENIQKIKEEIVNEFVTSVVLRKYAEKSGLPSVDDKVDEQVNKVRSSYPDDLTFRNALAEEGLSLDAWKNSVRQSIYEKMVFENVSKETKTPTDDEIANYYKANKTLFETPARVRLRQVVLEKEEDAKRIMARLKQGGTNIEKLAKEFSVAPEGKNGGDTGWVQKGALDVFDLAFKMNIGSKSEIVKSTYGYHIFEVLGKKPAIQLSLAEAKPKIIVNLKAEKERESFQLWLSEQIKTTKIKKDEKLISAIKVHTEN